MRLIQTFLLFSLLCLSSLLVIAISPDWVSSFCEIMIKAHLFFEHSQMRFILPTFGIWGITGYVLARSIDEE